MQDGSVILLWQCRWALIERAGAISFLLPPADEKLGQIPGNVPQVGHMSPCCEWHSVMDLHGTDGLAFEHSECASLLQKKYLLSAGKAGL